MTDRSNEELAREYEMIHALKYTKQQIDLYKRIIQETSTVDIARMTDEELLALSEELFTKDR